MRAGSVYVWLIVALVGGALVFVALASSSPLGGALGAVGMAVSAVGAVAAAKMFDTMRPHLLRPRLSEAQADPRAPKVFLRSFLRDSERLTGHGIPASSDSFWDRYWTLEDLLCRELAATGPVVAIGRPDEKLPQVGALRLYVDGENWRPVLKDLLDVASLIVVRADSSAGVLWELSAIREGGHLHKCTLLLVGSDGLPMGQADYLHFAKILESQLGIEMPVAGWNSWYVVFPRGAAAEALASKKPWSTRSELLQVTRTMLQRFGGVS